MAEITFKEVQALVTAAEGGSAYLAGLDLSGLDLTSLDLRGANFMPQGRCKPSRRGE